MSQNLSRPEDDQQLAIFIEQGNQQSFGVLYDKYASGLLGIISMIVNNNKIAEEVLNITFVNAWNHIVNFNSSNSSLFIWLINLARQTAFDKVKKEEAPNLYYASAVYDEKYRGASHRISFTGQKQLSAFDLVYYKGRTFEEAAKELNKSDGELMQSLRNGINAWNQEILC